MVLVISKMGVKSPSCALLLLLQPWGQRAAAVPLLQLVQGSGNAGYREAGALRGVGQLNCT